ncbi:Methyltransferase domain-containing protein [Rhizobiales bacterium GAS191]|nr:Methyltransferase domain-containing protein [Rhizobiales bacterium GAS191]
MDVSEFDQFADEYYEQHRAVIRITGEEPDYFAEYKIRVFHEWTGLLGVSGNDILDFGSGIGNSVPHFRTYFPGAKLTCSDVSRRSLDLAESRFPGPKRSVQIEGDRIPSPDGAFDAAFSACVFHHIPHDQHRTWLDELYRVTRPGGILAIFEHNPLNPLTVRAVNSCPFDVNAHLIRARDLAAGFRRSGWEKLNISYHVFFPRALAALRPFERRLSRLPLGAQYSIVATKPA